MFEYLNNKNISCVCRTPNAGSAIDTISVTCNKNPSQGLRSKQHGK